MLGIFFEGEEMLERFLGDNGKRLLVRTLLTQKAIGGNVQLAEKIVSRVELRALTPGEVLITQEGTDNDLFLIIDGIFDIVVNGQRVAQRTVNDLVGEMSAVDSTLRRSASVIATTPSTVAVVPEVLFEELGREFPELYIHTAKLIAQKLRQRNQLVRAANSKTRVFMISSVEALPIARAVHNAFAYDPFDVIPWNEGVFKATQYTLKTLEQEVDRADFAIAIAHADDIVEYKEKDWPTPRDNVIFELGLFMGRLGTDRAILLEPRNNKIRLPSDLAGVTTITYRFEKNGCDNSAHMATACNQLRDYILERGPRRDC